LADRLVRATKNRKRITYPQIKRAWNSLQLPKGYAYLIIRRYLTSHIQSDIAVFTWENYKAAAVNIPGKWRKKSEKAVFAAMMLKWKNHVKDTKKKNPDAKVKSTKSTKRKSARKSTTVKRRKSVKRGK
jgi:vacuolar-type H+-ATPase subunit F/Vma7